MQVTLVITLGDDAPEYHYLRSAMLLRKMANAMEDGQHLPSVGFSQGHNFECIKLTKVDPDAN